jgi:HK97 family phage prohead protease
MSTATATKAGSGTAEERAVWTTAYVNNLPDSAFLHIEPGGSKDSSGKTTPRSLRHFPYRDASGKIDMPHLRNALSRIPQANLPQSVKDAATAKAERLMQGMNSGRDDRKEEFRALVSGYELRDDGAELPTLVGTLAVFDEWAEINSRAEGHFLERISPSAFNKTIQENRSAMRVLFQHGKDPQIGDKPLGPIKDIYTDDRAAHYEVQLLDTTYNRDIVEMLRSDPPVLGSSFRFEVLRDDWARRPGKSAHNPRGLDERTVQEVRMPEFGPVTFPAYRGTKAGLRSLTDRMTLGAEELRLDAEDLGCLAQMIELGTGYIAEQDEPDEQVNIPKMEAILVSLAELLPAETSETEPVEPEEMMNHADPAIDAPSVRDAAQKGTSRRSAAHTVHALHGAKQKEEPKWLLR